MARKDSSFKDDPIRSLIDPIRGFVNDSYRLVNKCSKPDAKGKHSHSDICDFTNACALEFKKIAFATTIGFLVMGFTGFIVKLIHIPINNILVGQ